MSSRYRHDTTPLLDGDIDHRLFDNAPYSSSQPAQQQPLAGLADALMASPPGPASQAEAKRDRRRQQVREAQARFRDRKDRTAEELRARTIVLSDALEKARNENRQLRARLSRYERVDVPADEALEGVAGGAAGSGVHTSSWTGASDAHKSERSPVNFRGPQLSGPQHVGWDQPGQSLLSEEPLSLSAPAHMEMASHTPPQQSRPPSSSAYSPPARQGLTSSYQQPNDRDRATYAATASTSFDVDRHGKSRKVEEGPVHLSAPGGPPMRAFAAVSADHGRLHGKANMTPQGIWSPVTGFDYVFPGGGGQGGQQGVWRGGPAAAPASAGPTQPFGPSGGPLQLQSPHEGRGGQNLPMQGQGHRLQGEGIMGHAHFQGDSTKGGFAQVRDDRTPASLDTVSRWHSTMPPVHMLDGQSWATAPQTDHQPAPHQEGRVHGSGVPALGPRQGHIPDGQ